MKVKVMCCVGQLRRFFDVYSLHRCVIYVGDFLLPEKYVIDSASFTVRTNEALTPGCPPYLTQQTIGKFLQPLTRELVEVSPRPTIDELPDAVIDNMVRKDKAFWVDRPGTNAYTLHDAYYSYDMRAEIVKTPHQDVFPRSYQYELDCVKYRRLHTCDGLKQTEGEKQKLLSAHCRDCHSLNVASLSPLQLAWIQDPGQKRWRYYPDLTTKLTTEEIRLSMNEVGRPFQREACQWYNENYPSTNYNCILRKFSK